MGKSCAEESKDTEMKASSGWPGCSLQVVATGRYKARRWVGARSERESDTVQSSSDLNLRAMASDKVSTHSDAWRRRLLPTEGGTRRVDRAKVEAIPWVVVRAPLREPVV